MVKDFVTDVRNNGMKAIKANVQAWYNKLQESGKLPTWRGENGEYQFDLYLPLPLDDLQTTPKVTVDLGKYYTQMKNLYDQYAPSTWNLRDLYYKYKPSRDPREWVPPFRGEFSIHETVGTAKCTSIVFTLLSYVTPPNTYTSI